jgi:hypothetical protein
MGSAVAALALLALGGLSASPAHAEPLLATEGVEGKLVGGGQKEVIPLTITSLQRCPKACRKVDGRKGIARIGMPPPQEFGGQLYPLGVGDGNEQPQVTDSKLSGFVVIDPGSCKRAVLEKVGPPAIVVRYRCERGKDFHVDYIPRVGWFNFDGSGYDKWQFTISHRQSTADRWRELSVKPGFEVGPVVIEQPNLLYTAPPAPLTGASVNQQGEITLQTQGTKADGTKTQASIFLAPVIYSGNLEPLTLAANVDMNAFRSIEQVPIQVNSCVDGIAPPDPTLAPSPEIKSLVCSQLESPFGVVKVQIPPGVLTTPYSGEAWIGAFGAGLSTTAWTYSARDCSAVGGSWSAADTTSSGRAPADWSCNFPASKGYTTQMLNSIAQGWDDNGTTHCTSRDVRVDENWVGGGGADIIWCVAFVVG